VVVATAVVGVTVVEKKSFAREREIEREVVRPPSEVVGRLLVVDILVVNMVVRVVVAEGTADKEKKERRQKREKQGRVAGFFVNFRSIFFILWP
jgi:hypothetical protein